MGTVPYVRTNVEAFEKDIPRQNYGIKLLRRPKIMLNMNFGISLLLVFIFCSIQSNGFSVVSSFSKQQLESTRRFSSVPSDVDNASLEFEVENTAERAEIKAKLVQLCASYDRGFGASPKARQQVEELVEKLEALNPTPSGASQGVDGNATPDGTVPLKGIWRMVWTTALDVLNLGASPIATAGAIYQVIDPPIATNIIDFIPRIQSLFPTSFPPSLIRAEVKTRTSKRSTSSNRVGLNFEAVKLVPVEVLGFNPDFLPPFAVNFPQIKLEDLPGVDPETAPGFFDVTYLDSDMLIIKQNAPGGYFVSIKVDSYEP